MLFARLVLTGLIVIGFSSVADQDAPEVAVRMTPAGPSFRFPLAKLVIPTLEIMSRALAKDLRSKIYNFASEFSRILMKHFTSETEIHIVDGGLTGDSVATLQQLESEMDLLQYRKHLHHIVDPWKSKLGGQPAFPEVHNHLDGCVDIVFSDFESFIYEIQSEANKKMREGNQQLCNKACSRNSKILNLTEFNIPAELDKMLADGCNSVPLDELSYDSLKDLFEKDLILSAINYFRDENKVYPLVNQALGLKSVLEQLLSQAPSNSKQVEFYTTMYNNYVSQKQCFHNQLGVGHFIDSPAVQNILPVGTILTVTDKGLGPCLLPVDWYVEQYKVQSQKGNHVVTGMSADQCINFLKKAIESFRVALCPEERVSLKNYFAHSNPNFKVGVLKLVPKVHKLSVFDSQAWKHLPSRPIRGAENCPINPYSKALCKMLQEMHSSLEDVLSNSGISIPVIYGCDEYSEKIQQVEFDRSAWSRKTLISGDFSDAYTKSSLCDLQSSISKLGTIAGWPEHKINLAKKLAGLVFENCYFETPCGILRQTQGFPMGGHSSREGLDNILLASEVDLLNSTIKKNLLFYYRLVDDISLALDGDFCIVKDLLSKMAEGYPHAMPLNVQISFGYSHFLDSHVYNFLQSTPVNRFTTSLAYKPLSRFDYVPFSSNIAPLYKGNIIRIVLLPFYYVLF